MILLHYDDYENRQGINYIFALTPKYSSQMILKNNKKEEMIRNLFHFDSDSLIDYLAKLFTNGGS